MVVVFAGSVFTFNSFGYEAQFVKKSVMIVGGESSVSEEKINYVLPPIVQPYQSELVKADSFLGLKKPLFSAPSWMEGVNAGRKLNTIIWTLLITAIIYLLLRLILRRSLGAAISPIMKDMDEQDLDEISYRTIAIGFPIFTLGALIFAMIWAAQAWGRFWGWDPKETWALITWLFYAAYLHLRLSRGWHGAKSAWLSVIGFIIVMFTLVGVNLLISGLHSYSGV
jgi:ABC-type transport system involved in cytochrome c biogenesis permease subunit